jgi:hypothetical protein
MCSASERHMEATPLLHSVVKGKEHGPWVLRVYPLDLGSTPRILVTARLGQGSGRLLAGSRHH